MGINTLHPNSGEENFKGRTIKRSFVNSNVISTPPKDFSAVSFVTQEYTHLNSLGWKFISYPFPYELDITTFLHFLLFPDRPLTSFSHLAISEKVNLIKNNAGEAYFPEFGFNGIENAIPGQGYQIKLKTGLGSNIKAIPIDAQVNNIISLTEYVDALKDISINFLEGWNLIGYYGYEPLNAVEAFASVVDDIQIVKDFAGNIYWPEFNFNGLHQDLDDDNIKGFLLPGHGYQVRTKNAINNFKFEPFSTNFNITPAADLNNLFA